jgi:hypothetical protein
VLIHVTNLCGRVGRCSASGGVVLLCLHVSDCELHCVHDILPCLSVSHFGSKYQKRASLSPAVVGCLYGMGDLLR